MIYAEKILSRRGLWMFATSSCFTMLLVASSVSAQEAADHSSLAQQLRELQSQVAKLEATLKQNVQTPAMTDQGMMKRGGKPRCPRSS